MKSVIVGLEMCDGISGLSGVLAAMVRAGAATEPVILAADTINPGIAASALTKVVLGKTDGRMVAIMLPSALFLRHLADEIEKLP